MTIEELTAKSIAELRRHNELIGNPPDADARSVSRIDPTRRGVVQMQVVPGATVDEIVVNIFSRE